MTAQTKPQARAVTLFVGELRQLPGMGSLTGMFKQPVTEPLHLARNGLAGDRQGDRAVHGGPERALLHYPAEHYDHWREVYPDRAEEFQVAALGENLSSRGWSEADLRVGDVFRLGTARIQVSQPRQPCVKIAKRMRLPDLARRVSWSGRSGWFYRVLEEGIVAPGDRLELEQAAAHGFTLAQLWEMRNTRQPALHTLAAMAQLAELAESWRQAYAGKLAYLAARATPG
ncbi:MAG: MOSC domain-containing protein [Salinisphaera sp.]|nr:MOSC domain-containing protein [Salinisphaera sp.]MDN5937116.1 MOSC domain-containing protein [Salinisphaera sp.]